MPRPPIPGQGWNTPKRKVQVDIDDDTPLSVVADIDDDTPLSVMADRLRGRSPAVPSLQSMAEGPAPPSQVIVDLTLDDEDQVPTCMACGSAEANQDLEHKADQVLSHHKRKMPEGMGGAVKRADKCLVCEWPRPPVDPNQVHRQRGTICGMCRNFMKSKKKRTLKDLEDPLYFAEVKAHSLQLRGGLREEEPQNTAEVQIVDPATPPRRSLAAASQGVEILVADSPSTGEQRVLKRLRRAPDALAESPSSCPRQMLAATPPCRVQKETPIPRCSFRKRCAAKKPQKSTRSCSALKPSGSSLRTCPPAPAPGNGLEGVVLSGYTQVRRCDRSLRKAMARLFHRTGWPGPRSGVTRLAISELLGTSMGKSRTLATTHVAWASLKEQDGSSRMVGAAILSLYRRKEQAGCGCLEYIVSKHRGVGRLLVQRAQEFLQKYRLCRLFSGADMSRRWAVAAHEKWGFLPITREEWTAAGLDFYAKGDVMYMMLQMPRRSLLVD